MESIKIKQYDAPGRAVEPNVGGDPADGWKPQALYFYTTNQRALCNS